MMRNRRIVYPVVLGAILGVVWLRYSQGLATAQEGAKYVGSETCAMCHAEVLKKWELTVHRRTLFNTEPSKRGCEACHGPGGEHVAGGGDKSKIIRLGTLSSEESAAICQKCHSQEEVTLWATSRHARSKLTCVNCHDPHSVGEKALLADVDNAKLTNEGLTKSLKQAQQAADIAAPGSEERKAADEKVVELKAQIKEYQTVLKGAETEYQRTAEPYVCYNCHKAQQVQSRMPSHHPIPEGKVLCSSCHNPHGGLKGMLRKESVNETCRTCHAEKAGPFVYEHPPVNEDCLNCHNAHGSVQNALLTQNQAFLCMKCHSGTHSPNGDAKRFAQRYTMCTNCHTQIHGSDTHKAYFN